MDNMTDELLSSFRAPAYPNSYFLSFEGIEGAGKTTQIILLKEYLENRNFRVVLLREPGGTVFGEKLREAILQTKSEISPLAEAHLFAASRCQLLTEIILKELEVEKTVVICDRYLDSSLAYQGHARGLGVEKVLELHKHFPLNTVPHLTFYLRIDAETSEKRQLLRNSAKDYFESKGMEFYRKLVVGYDQAQSLFPERMINLNAAGSPEEVKKLIIEAIEKLLNKKIS